MHRFVLNGPHTEYVPDVSPRRGIRVRLATTTVCEPKRFVVPRVKIKYNAVERNRMHYRHSFHGPGVSTYTANNFFAQADHTTVTSDSRN
jgi:hypothetical protein